MLQDDDKDFTAVKFQSYFMGSGLLQEALLLGCLSANLLVHLRVS